MVNSLMRVWKTQNENHPTTYRGWTAREALDEMCNAYDNLDDERRLHTQTKKRYSTLTKTNTSLRKQIECQKEQIIRLKKMKNQQNQKSELEIIESMGANRCKYVFTKGKFLGEFCGACCKNYYRCNAHKNK